MVVDLLKKADYDNEVIGTESKITSITALATTAAVNAVKNEIPNVSDAEKKKKQKMMAKYQTLKKMYV